LGEASNERPIAQGLPDLSYLLVLMSVTSLHHLLSYVRLESQDCLWRKQACQAQRSGFNESKCAYLKVPVSTCLSSIGRCYITGFTFCKRQNEPCLVLFPRVVSTVIYQLRLEDAFRELARRYNDVELCLTSLTPVLYKQLPFHIVSNRRFTFVRSFWLPVSKWHKWTHATIYLIA
jgi:hypothetical protein